MEAISKHIQILVLPVVLFVYAIMLKEQQGNYYNNYYDPSYVYLISSLNLTQGENVEHVDHPGTTVQLIGAVVLKIYFAFSKENTDIVTDVLSRSEDYLRIINIVLVIINCLLLFLLGIINYTFSKNLLLTFLLQLTVFVSWEIFYGLLITTPDNLLVGISISYLILISYYYYKIDENASAPWLFIVLFAVISGFGIATKLNFIPMLLIPLILIRGFKNKMLFSILSLTSFFLFVLPVISNFSKFLDWMYKLIINSGMHGQGQPTVINGAIFFENIYMTFTENYFFLFTFLFTAFTLLFSYSQKNYINIHMIFL